MTLINKALSTRSYCFLKQVIKDTAPPHVTKKDVKKLDYDTIQSIIHAYSGCIGYDYKKKEFFYK